MLEVTFNLLQKFRKSVATSTTQKIEINDDVHGYAERLEERH